MSDELEFFLPMIPPTTTHQQKTVRVRDGKPVFFEGAKLTAARSKLMSALSRHVPPAKLDGPLEVSVTWCFALISGSYDGQPKHTRPDTHNLSKLLYDCMTDLGYWHDDGQVALEHIGKFWAETTGIHVHIRKMPIKAPVRRFSKKPIATPRRGCENAK